MMKSIRPSIAAGAMVIGTVLSAGCQRYDYTIEMKAEGNVLVRKLTVPSRPDSKDGKNSSDVASGVRIHRYDPQSATFKNGRQTLIGRFVGKTPDDIGGAGSLVHLTSRMGTASAYIERFRGTDDLVGELEKSQRAVDEFVDLFIDWLRWEMNNESDFKALESFLDKQFRRDVKNVALYAGLLEARVKFRLANSDENAGVEMFVHGAQFLVERGYITTEELPEVNRAIRHADRGNSERLLKVVQRFLSLKIKSHVDESIPASLTPLSNPEHVAASFQAYSQTSAKYHALAKQFAKRNQDTIKYEPADVMVDLFWRMIGFDPVTAFDSLKVQFAVPVQPIATNGVWNADARSVHWSAELGIDGHRMGMLPTVLYATWCIPDEAFQRAHFGKVVLDKDSLAEYCLWRNALTTAEAERWDRWIDGLAPGDELMDRIDAFRFSGEPIESRDEDPPTSHADIPRELLKAGLDGG